MSKKVILEAALLSAIIIASFLGFRLYKDSQASKDSRLVDQAISAMDESLCGELRTSSEFISKDACYNYIAQNTDKREYFKSVFAPSAR